MHFKRWRRTSEYVASLTEWKPFAKVGDVIPFAEVVEDLQKRLRVLRVRLETVKRRMR